MEFVYSEKPKTSSIDTTVDLNTSFENSEKAQELLHQVEAGMSSEPEERGSEQCTAVQDLIENHEDSRYTEIHLLENVIDKHFTVTKVEIINETQETPVYTREFKQANSDQISVNEPKDVQDSGNSEKEISNKLNQNNLVIPKSEIVSLNVSEVPAVHVEEDDAECEQTGVVFPSSMKEDETAIPRAVEEIEIS